MAVRINKYSAGREQSRNSPPWLFHASHQLLFLLLFFNDQAFLSVFIWFEEKEYRNPVSRNTKKLFWEVCQILWYSRCPCLVAPEANLVTRIQIQVIDNKIKDNPSNGMWKISRERELGNGALLDGCHCGWCELKPLGQLCQLFVRLSPCLVDHGCWKFPFTETIRHGSTKGFPIPVIFLNSRKTHPFPCYVAACYSGLMPPTKIGSLFLASWSTGIKILWAFM